MRYPCYRLGAEYINCHPVTGFLPLADRPTDG
jgi:hypothetical protein